MVDFLPFFTRDFCDFLFTFLLEKSLLKRTYSKRKEFAPKESKFFIFRVDPFPEGKIKQILYSCLPESIAFPFTFSVWQTKTNTFSNSVDPFPEGK